MPTLPSMEPVRGGRTPRIPVLREAGSRAARHSSCSRTNRRCRLPQNLASERLACNEGKIRRGRRAGVLLAPHTYLFFPTRTIAQEISRVESSCSLWAASGAGSAAKPKMSKPQIILNAGCAAIAMAIAYRLANLMIDRVLPKKKVEEEEPADEPKAHPALDLLQMCVNGDVDAARLLLDNGAGPRVPPLLPSSWAARGRS